MASHLKKLWLSSLFIFIFSTLLTSHPMQVAYQGKVTTDDGTPLNGLTTIVFTLYSNDTAIWQESYSNENKVSVTNGHFNVALGALTPLTTDILQNNNITLGIKINEENELTPRSPLLSAPYAFRSLEAQKLNGFSSSDFLKTNSTLDATNIQSGQLSTDRYNALADLNGGQGTLFLRQDGSWAMPDIQQATNSESGLFSPEDKAKLDGIASNANNYVHPNTSGSIHLPSGGGINQLLQWQSDGAGQWAAPEYRLFDAWFRAKDDASAFKLLSGLGYQMTFRADAVTPYSAGVRGDAYVWMYGGNTASHQMMGLTNSGKLWTKSYGLLDDAFAPKTLATQAVNGLMSASDKNKLDNINDHVDDYVLPEASATTLGGVKVGGNLAISNGILSATYSAATPFANGLMASGDKAKLDGVAANANNYNHPTTAGHIHLPSGGTADQLLQWHSNGTGQWASPQYKLFDPWLRAKNDAAVFKLLSGLSNQMVFRADATSPYSTGVRSDAFVWMYGGNSGSNQVMGVLSNGKLWTKAYGLLEDKFSDKSVATGSQAGLMSSSDKNKLDNINDHVDDYTLPAATASTLGGVKVGNNLSMSNGVLSAVGYSNATGSQAGLMSSSDKNKLDNINDHVDDYTLPAATASTLGGVKVGNNLSMSNGVLSAAGYSNATGSQAGLMSSSDKNKLDNINDHVDDYTLPAATASTLGGVKVGNNLSMSNGVLSAVGYSNATGSQAGLMSSSDKNKLDNINDHVDDYILPAATASTLGGVKVGNNLSMSNGVLSAVGYSNATGSQAGLMSSSDKNKLDNINDHVDDYILPAATATTLGGVKIGNNLSMSNGVLSAVGYSNATASQAGLMSSSDKTKLNGIATNANNYVHPTTSGYKHIPSGGSSGQVLSYLSDGTAQWTTLDANHDHDETYLQDGSVISNFKGDTTLQGQLTIKGDASYDGKTYLFKVEDRPGGSADGRVVFQSSTDYNSRHEFVFNNTTFNSYYTIDNEMDITTIKLNSGGYSYINGGNVGMGTTQPRAKLHIVSSSEATLANNTGAQIIGNQSNKNIVIDTDEIQARNNASASDLYINPHGGSTHVYQFINASDRRLKSDIKPITVDPTTITKLQPVSFRWKSDKKAEEHIGFIAQDVQKRLPEVVSQADDGHLGINYSALTTLLIETVKEQQQQISDLKSRIEALESAK